MCLLLYFIVIDAILFFAKIKFKNSCSYKLRRAISCCLFITCLVDTTIALALTYYPMLNLLFRGFIFVLNCETVRKEWRKILKVSFYAKSIFFMLLFNWLIYSLMGHLLFADKVKGFSTYPFSLDTMFSLSTNNNFPDIMLLGMDYNKFSTLFFVSYVIMNLLVLMPLMGVIYYSHYLTENKNNVIKIIEKMRSGKYKIDPKKSDKFLAIIIKQISFKNEEYQLLKEFVDCNHSLERRQSDLDNLLETRKKSVILRWLRKKYIELFINLINIGLILLFVLTEAKSGSITILSIHLIPTIYFILEFSLYIKYYSITKIFLIKTLRSIFFIICLISLISSTITIIIELTCEQDVETMKFISNVFIVLKALRFLIFLNMFEEFKYIHVTLHNLKSTLGILISVQFSFIFNFSTLSMFILGGAIKDNEFINNASIPNEYHRINFNDYSSSFLSCFSLMMVNNFNVITDALASPVAVWFKAYFSVFYFLGVIIILNIWQTFILDMYVEVNNFHIKVERALY